MVHLGERGRGPAATDLRRITSRIQQGWTSAMRSESGPISAATRRVSTWCRSSRSPGRRPTSTGSSTRRPRPSERDAHRELLAELERRSQQVWVPVTVATLLPGSLLLLVPFLDALRLFAGA